MGLDYHYTCPDIDKNIKVLKEGLEDYFYNLIEEISPLVPIDTIKDLAKNYSKELYENIIEDSIENIRYTNEQLRKAAENQIECLESDIDDLKQQLNELE